MFSDSHWLKSPIVTIMKTFFARRLDDKINDLIVLKTTTVPLIPAGLKGNWFRSERNHELIPNTQNMCMHEFPNLQGSCITAQYKVK